MVCFRSLNYLEINTYQSMGSVAISKWSGFLSVSANRCMRKVCVVIRFWFLNVLNSIGRIILKNVTVSNFVVARRVDGNQQSYRYFFLCEYLPVHVGCLLI